LKSQENKNLITVTSTRNPPH